MIISERKARRASINDVVIITTFARPTEYDNTCHAPKFWRNCHIRVYKICSFLGGWLWLAG
jgi:hypothetical protein